MRQADAGHLRISLVAPSGSGKSSTAAFMLERCAMLGLSARVVKLAEPLYDLQRRFYAVAGIDIPDKAQNQRLMEAIATHLRLITPDALVRDFLRRLHAEHTDVVINDDLRDMATDLPALRREGFVTVRVSADPTVIRSRLAIRQDLQIETASPLDRAVLSETPDYVIVNTGDDIDAYRRQVHRFVDLMIAERADGLMPAEAAAGLGGRR